VLFDQPHKVVQHGKSTWFLTLRCRGSSPVRPLLRNQPEKGPSDVLFDQPHKVVQHGKSKWFLTLRCRGSGPVRPLLRNPWLHKLTGFKIDQAQAQSLCAVA
jgi:hypothetical protein